MKANTRHRKTERISRERIGHSCGKPHSANLANDPLGVNAFNR